MPDLIGVNGDRAADLLRSRAFRVTVVGRTAVSRRAAGHRAAAVAAGGLPDCARRADFPRGQPVSVLLAPSILSADFAGAGRGDRGRRARRRRPDSRGRDGRPFRAQHHASGRRSSGRSKRVARLPLDVHLMIAEPDRYLEAFAEAGADMDLGARRRCCPTCTARSARSRHSEDRPAWCSIRPRRSAPSRRSPPTSISCSSCRSIRDSAARSSSRTARTRCGPSARCSIAPAAGASIEIDGGIDESNIARVVAAGADILVAGSAIFDTPDPEAAARHLKALAAAAAASRPVGRGDA